MPYDDYNYELSIRLMQSKLGLMEKEVEDETSTQWGGNISIPNLKKLYGRLLHRCNQLEEPSDEDEAEELRKTKDNCIKAFLLF